jgi:Lrp/AsnC family transcriptional regulator, regulator for asnA, asnC and gidA
MYEIDETDCKIVDLLMEDGRMNAAEIARRMGGELSERAIRYRINRMVEESVIRVSAIPNPGALGFTVIADVFVEVEPALISEVAHALAEFENVSYVACSIGERDISAQIIARDNTEVYAFATEVIGRLPGVRKTTTSIVPIRLKDVYQWRIPRSVREVQLDEGKE